MLGHELRNALNGFAGVAELLGTTRLSGEQRHLLEALQQSGRQLRWLIESVNPEGGKTEFPFTAVPAELNGIDLLEQVIRCHTPAATESDNLLLYKIEADLPAWWNIDGRLLRQLIDNLLANAIKFTCSGIVEIEARRPSGGRGSDTSLELLVRDTGPGIDSASSQRIFEPWVRLEENQKSSGSGLGLHICQRIVSSLGGTVDCYRESGTGSCFRAYLPGVLDPLPARKSGPVSRLFSSMICRISAGDRLRASLESVLGHLGIRVEPFGKVMGSESGMLLEILISQLDIPCDSKAPQAGLLFTYHPRHSDRNFLLQARRLQAPFLESTLGPLLMEMALAWRILLQESALKIRPDDSQG